jgi:CRISPR/Cas system-associated exonuclease Cas4 (RecB family)
MKTIRASEISSYCFCQRAWWYHLQGFESENQAELSGGSELHVQHGRSVKLAGCLNTLAIGLLILAIAAMIVWLAGVMF